MKPSPKILSLVKAYFLDWIFLFVLIFGLSLINLIHPFQRYINLEILGDLMFPLKSNTVPGALLPVIGFVVPLLCLLAFSVVRGDKAGFHQSLLGLTYTIIYTGLIVDGLKISVGRPRPDFFERCFPNGTAIFQLNGDVKCTGNPAVIREGYKSFPSGHSSWSFSGLGYLSLQIAGKLHVFSREGHISKIAFSALPIVGATAVGVTRIDDYWHHWTDVVTGATIGLVVAYLCYRQHFPPLSDKDSDRPYIEIDRSRILLPDEGLLPTPEEDLEAGSAERSTSPTEGLERPPRPPPFSLSVRRSTEGTGEIQEASSGRSQLRTASLDSSQAGSVSAQLHLRPVEDVVLGVGYKQIEKALYGEQSSKSAMSYSTLS